MTTILAIETATAACSAAVWRDGVGSGRFEVLGRGHGERLLPMIADVLAEAGVAAAELDAIAVGRGPGAFTGLRIGLAAARGMALALGRPCHALTTLETLAAAALPVLAAEQAAVPRPLLVALDSKRGDVFAQLFAAAGEPLAPPAALAIADLPAYLAAGTVAAGPLAIAGDAEPMLATALAAAGWAAQPVAGCVWPRADVLAACIGRLIAAGGTAPSPPSPFYLRGVATGPSLAGAGG